MKPELASITIRPGKNGGHTVRHEFQSAPSYSKVGGMSMASPQGEDHSFGPNDNQNLMAHLATALAIKGVNKPLPPKLGRQRSTGEQQDIEE